VAIESRSMVLGAVALAAYSCVVCQYLMRLRTSAPQATLGALAVWLAIAIGLEQLLIG
jgi:hypothetical protein